MCRNKAKSIYINHVNIAISCGEFQLGNEMHLQVTQTDSHYGDTLILNCETGYVMTDGENSAVFECDINGQWIGIIPTCNGKYSLLLFLIMS